MTAAGRLGTTAFVPDKQQFLGMEVLKKVQRRLPTLKIASPWGYRVGGQVALNTVNLKTITGNSRAIKCLRIGMPRS